MKDDNLLPDDKARSGSTLTSASLLSNISVGTVTGDAAQIVMDLSGVVTVNTVPAVRDHWRKHAGQFDVEKAEEMMASVLADPLRVYRDKKANTVAFVESLDDKYYLIIPVKCLKGELWVSTMYAEEKTRFARRKWVQDGLLYERIN